MRTPTIVPPERRGRCCARTPRSCPLPSMKTVSKSVGSPRSAARRNWAETFLRTSGASRSVIWPPSIWVFDFPEARSAAAFMCPNRPFTSCRLAGIMRLSTIHLSTSCKGYGMEPMVDSRSPRVNNDGPSPGLASRARLHDNRPLAVGAGLPVTPALESQRERPRLRRLELADLLTRGSGRTLSRRQVVLAPDSKGGRDVREAPEISARPVFRKHDDDRLADLDADVIRIRELAHLQQGAGGFARARFILYQTYISWTSWSASSR